MRNEVDDKKNTKFLSEMFAYFIYDQRFRVVPLHGTLQRWSLDDKNKRFQLSKT